MKISAERDELSPHKFLQKILGCAGTLAFVVGIFFVPARAVGDPMSPLEVLGVDSSGNQLIYDANLNVTWYDYSAADLGWRGSNQWASSLVVDFQGADVAGWKLPSATDFSGTGTGAASDVTRTAMGYLFYKEFGAVGSLTAPPDHGPFKNLLPDWFDDPANFNPDESVPPATAFWLSTPSPVDTPFPYNMAYDFNFINGRQGLDVNGESDVDRAIAIHEGRVAVPESSSSIVLLGSGLAALVAFCRRRAKAAADRTIR